MAGQMLRRFAVRRPAYSEVLKVTQTRVFYPPCSAGARIQTRDFARKSVWKPRTTKVETEMSPRDRDILSRITVVEEVAESARVVEHLIRQGQPVAVDVEGNTLGVTGLVQVKDSEGNFTFFRTARNPDLFKRGRLGELLESPFLRKIMHAASTDLRSLYQDGVKVWGVYDTEVAHRVLEYQARGDSMYSANQIGLNALCQYCGLEENPLKGSITFWKGPQVNTNENAEVMTQDFLLYAAWDVEQLHEMYSVLSSLLAPDYANLVDQLNELAIIRCIDGDLAKLKRTSLRSMETCGIFLSQLDHTLGKPALYQLAATLQGHKHIYFSGLDNTAHLILESRFAAAKAIDFLRGRAGDQLGARVKLRLVWEMHPTEARELREEMVASEEPVARTEAGSLASCREVSSALLSSRAPVVLDFCEEGKEVLAELYVGSGPSFKFPLESTWLEAGLGEVLASTEVAKVLIKVDSTAAAAALKTLTRHGLKLNNVFDLGFAANVLDYIECGQSIFTSTTKKVLKMMNRYQIPVDMAGEQMGKLERYYVTYLHLAQAVPPAMVSYLQERTALEVAICSYVEVAHNKELRGMLRTRMDSNTLHLRLEGKAGAVKENQRSFLRLAREALEKEAIAMVEVRTHERFSLLELETRGQALKALKVLGKLELSSGLKFRVAHPYCLGTGIDKPSTPPADLARMAGERREHLARLRVGGLHLGLEEREELITEGGEGGLEHGEHLTKKREG